MRRALLWAGAGVFAVSLALAACQAPGRAERPPDERRALPTPQTAGERSLEEALAERRSVREFAPRPLTDAEVGQLLWAAQGVNRPGGYRTAPSAGAFYPLELYLVDAAAVWRYNVAEHSLERWGESDRRAALCQAALNQEAVCHAPAVFVFTAVPERTTGKYGQRGLQYIWLEAGHAAQNLLLQAAALGLGAVPIGAFHDDGLLAALATPPDQIALYLIAVGQPRP
ncbi:MAG: SagB/ThcOx family dehydrogenase [Chloroflexi bacterium]|nr:SagB/ThcOx family dehydrogenase [Chloroflexota bacterium]